ncbi:Uncharacterised protein [Candidatus Tiddalikarchaeum anstoanum]|nr:Uncharacterised protein [Candidatus Tiddalikarchaeum anstoanum]
MSITLNELLNVQEAFLTEFIINYGGIKVYNKLVQKYGNVFPITQYMRDKFNEKGISSNIDPLNNSTNRFCNAESIDDGVIGSFVKSQYNSGRYANSNLVGPFNEKLNDHEAPNVPRCFGARLERQDILTDHQEDYYLTYGLMDHIKAVLYFYGSRPVDYKIVDGKKAPNRTILDMLEFYDNDRKKIDFNTVGFNDEKFALDIFIKGQYKGHFGKFDVDSATKKDKLVHQVSIKQPVVIVKKNGSIYIEYRDNAEYSDTTLLCTSKLSGRPEYENNAAITKYVIMTMIALKKGTAYSNGLGHRISIELPENQEVESFNLQKVDDAVKTLLTLYEVIESPFMPNELLEEVLVNYNNEDGKPASRIALLADSRRARINKLFTNVIGEGIYLYYVLGWTEKQVDFHLLKKYGMDLLTPKLKWDLVNFQEDYDVKMVRTGLKSGSMVRGVLMPGTTCPPAQYQNRPVPFVSAITEPIQSGKTKVNNGERDVEAIITFGPDRDFKLHKCWVYNANPLFNKYQFYKNANVLTSCFGGWYKLGYMPNLLTEAEGGNGWSKMYNTRYSASKPNFTLIKTSELKDSKGNDLPDDMKKEWDRFIKKHYESRQKDLHFGNAIYPFGVLNKEFYSRPEEYLSFFYPLNTLEPLKKNSSNTEKEKFYQDLISYINFFKKQYTGFIPSQKNLERKIHEEVLNLENRKRIKINNLN